MADSNIPWGIFRHYCRVVCFGAREESMVQKFQAFLYRPYCIDRSQFSTYYLLFVLRCCWGRNIIQGGNTTIYRNLASGYIVYFSTWLSESVQLAFNDVRVIYGYYKCRIRLLICAVRNLRCHGSPFYVRYRHVYISEMEYREGIVESCVNSNDSVI